MKSTKGWIPRLLLCSLLAMAVPPSAEGWAAASSPVLVDDLEDWSRVYDRSASLVLREFPGGADDLTRVQSSGRGEEYITYRTKDPLRSFAVDAYYTPGGRPVDPPAFYASSDQVTYSPVTADVYDQGGYLRSVRYESADLPPDTRYLQIRYPAGASGEPPSIGKVVLNGAAGVRSSLPAGVVPYGSKAVLDTPTVGAAVYYTTDGSDPRTSLTRQPYEAPVDMLRYTVLKTCAFLDGAGAGRVSTYRYLPIPAGSGEGRISPALEDGYVDGGAPHAAYGGGGVLLVKKFRSREAYFKFRLPAGGETDTVTFQVYGYASDASRAQALLRLYSVSGGWSEGSLAYANKPLPLSVTAAAYGGTGPPGTPGIAGAADSLPPPAAGTADAVYGLPSSSVTGDAYGNAPLPVTDSVYGGEDGSSVTGLTYGQLLQEQRLEYGTPGWLQFDITGYAQEARRLGVQEISLALVNATDGMTFLNSRESGETAPFLMSSPGGGPGLTDPLDTFGKIYSRANVYLTGSDPASFGGDASRLTRSSTAKGSIVYRTSYDIGSLSVFAYQYAGSAVEKLRLYVSKDGMAYDELEAETYGAGRASGSWQPYVYDAGGLAEGIRYLRIELPESYDKPWAQQISLVQLNRGTPAVQLKTERGAGGLQAELSSASSGASLFYRLGEDAAFERYTGPIALTGHPRLQTYAVADGREPSPLRTYELNATDEIKVDRFGQIVSAPFPEKVKSERELRQDAKDDAAYYDGLNPPVTWDTYGGLAGSAERYGLAGTGYFAVGEAEGRPVLKTPEGNLFFSLGVNGLTNIETYTMVRGREGKYEWIPPAEGEYQPAFVPGDPGSFSYYMANKYRKMGRFPSGGGLYTEAVGRLKKWGFNTAGGYSPEQYGSANRFPYVRMLPLSWMDWAKIPGLSLFDIFAPDAEKKIDETFAAVLPAHREDPMLLGYFLDNEYDYHKFHRQVPKLKGSKAAIKLRLVSELAAKYRSIGAFNAAWGSCFTSFDDMKEKELPLQSSASWKDMNDFFELYLDTFYGTVSRIYRKYDGNHLLLGDRWITTPFHDAKLRGYLAEASGKYMDVISINYYTRKMETDLLSEVHVKSGGKPILFSEFGYGTAEQGLKPLVPGTAANQNERQLRYRNYVEGAASLGYVVGVHWFNYVDQAPTGRYWQGIGDWAERYNSGLVNVADRPYKTFLAGAMRTNYDIYQVLLGERPRFYYDFSKPQ
ncbi:MULTISPECIES: CBM96 family carbohydrate-binding protein [Paenibacillus]|uniref:CBM96 family carbohydrate-binding protein n=1 Tax=Paenibacillus TaxID=44249 RepID=UPI0022B87579|nr:chitobiase/beta-hexosaminidase C-terminal domain-containing protein [Paenibacillus caseinilyticus]MCZ8520922.1 chitobiase/beta-hexosaminidase C-terminal domain-containing protein [Paenibacillus caseinilyticus]